MDGHTCLWRPPKDSFSLIECLACCLVRDSCCFLYFKELLLYRCSQVGALVCRSTCVGSRRIAEPVLFPPCRFQGLSSGLVASAVPKKVIVLAPVLFSHFSFSCFLACALWSASISHSFVKFIILLAGHGGYSKSRGKRVNGSISQHWGGGDRHIPEAASVQPIHGECL